MGSWRDGILKEFAPQASRLTLVADPDGLLLEEGVLKGIEERGFELIPFDDHVAFRFAYESRYRMRWDRGELTDLVVVLRAPEADLRGLPFDLLQAGRRLSFSLGTVFPHLSYPVIDALDRNDLDELYRAQERDMPDRPLGDRQTKGFVLRYVFGVAPETIRKVSDLLRFLLRRHYLGLRIPPVVDDHLVELLKQNSLFAAWPLDRIVSDREGFFAFLQERWPVFLDREASDEPKSHERSEAYGLEIPGPVEVPFDHQDVRVYIDDLFLEGLLHPVSHPRAERFAKTWVGFGVRTDPASDRQRRMEGLLDKVRKELPESATTHHEWLKFALRWARVLSLRYESGDSQSAGVGGALAEIQDQVDSAFFAWIQEKFATLHNHPPVPPVMLHHVPRLLARHLEEGRYTKAALVVMDGLSLDQWVVVQDVMSRQMPDLRFREGSVFAWVPSLTSVSRQACFAGRAPLYFPSSIHTTNREPASWKRFWLDQGLTGSEVGYERSLRDEPDLTTVDELASHPKMRALGLVVDKVDRIMHGMELGSRGMHNQIRQWAEGGMLAAMLDQLVGHGFTVFLTADHGNIEATGYGRPAEGALADQRGERARIYNDASLRDRVHGEYPEAIPWPPVGLPEDYLALLAPGRSVFIRPGDRLVGHGGISIEELIVPLVRIERR